MKARACNLALALLLLGAPAQTQEVRRFLAFGDSITEGIGDDAGGGGYPQRLEDLLAAEGVSSEVENQGLGGETTAEGLPRLRGLLASTDADTALILEGSNDISSQISEETTVFNLEEMAKAAESSGLAAVQVTMVLRGGPNNADPFNLFTGSLTAQIRRLAWQSERELVDPYQAFLEHEDDLESLYFDSIHPNAAGYDLLASTFLDVLVGRDSVPPVEGLMDPARGDGDVDPTSVLTVEIHDFGDGIDSLETRILVDGEPVATEVSGDGRRLVFVYEGGFPGDSRVAVSLQAADLAIPANTTDRVLGRFDTGESTTPDFPGDIDGDGRVDGDDLVILGLAFGSTKGEKRYTRDADLDGSGRIDGEDLAILAANFGNSA